MRHNLQQLVALGLLFCVDEVSARTWYVTPDGTGQAPTIQAAVDSCVDGDEVVLAPGSYTFASQGLTDGSMVAIRKSILLRGEAGAESTILDVQGNPGRAVQCYVPAVATIDGLTLTGGNPQFEQGRGAGGVFLTPGCTITNCIIRDNRTAMVGSGGGIAAFRATIRDCVVENNHAGADGAGGGIASIQGLISGCVIRGNSCGGDPGGYGGGIDSDHTEIVDCVIEGNLAGGPFGGSGGGVDAWGGSIRRCLIVNNVAQGFVSSGGRGGGVATSGLEPVSILDTVFIGNRAGEEGAGTLGGAVSASSMLTVVERCTFIGNSSGVDNGVVRNSIIAWCTTGPACDSMAIVTCSVLFGNALGDAVCGVGGGGNFTADPQFCALDPGASRNVGLQKDSPCADAPNCGLIGASPIACESVSVEKLPWSRVKSIYRR